jgi:hypothetical protein
MLESMRENPFLALVFEEDRLRIYCAGLTASQQETLETVVQDMASA